MAARMNQRINSVAIDRVAATRSKSAEFFVRFILVMEIPLEMSPDQDALRFRRTL